MSGRVCSWRAPGRVNLIGEHTDYNDGFALPFAIPAGVQATVWELAEPVLQISSSAQSEAFGIALTDLAPAAVTGWPGYPAGVVWALLQAAPTRQPSLSGVRIELDGDVPLGAGLSSSAAVVCSVAGALNELWQLDVSPRELVTVARQAENDFVGAPTGGLDQLASMLCTEGHALLLDTRAGTAEQVPFDPAAVDLTVLVIDSGERHSHATGDYAARRQACQQAAATLGVAALRDVTVPELPAALQKLAGEPQLTRVTRHVVSENARVLQTVQLLHTGRLADIGPLLDASHHSLATDFAVSTQRLDLISQAARTAGALGARMTGGGFGGCVIALTPLDLVPDVIKSVETAVGSLGDPPPRCWPVQPAAGAHPVQPAAGAS